MVGIADQIANSASNLLLIVVVARASSASDFGAFALAISSRNVLIPVARGLVVEPFTVLFAGSTERVSAMRDRAVASGLTIGLVAGLFVLSSVLLFGPQHRALLVILGLCLPVVIIQDLFRCLLLAEGRTTSALVNDLVWGVVQIAATLVVLAVPGSDVPTLVGAWGLGALAASFLGMFQLPAAGRPDLSLRFVRDHRRLGGPFALDLVAESAAGPVVLYAVGFFAGLPAAAGLRAGQAVFAPAATLVSGLRLVVLGESVRRRPGTPVFGRYIRGVGALGGLTMMTYAGAVLLLPETVGANLFGDSWSLAGMTILPLALRRLLTGPNLGAIIGLRALEAPRQSLQTRGFVAAASLVGGIIGAVLAEAVGAAWGLAGGAGVSAILWWSTYARVANRRTKGPERRTLAPS